MNTASSWPVGGLLVSALVLAWVPGLAFGQATGLPAHRGQQVLAAPITIEAKKMSLRQLLEFLAQKAELQYIVTDDVLDGNPTISLRLREVPTRVVCEYLEDFCRLKIDWRVLEDRGVLLLGRAGRAVVDDDDGEADDDDDDGARAEGDNEP